MSDLLGWSIRVGRWRDSQYRIHYVLLIFAAFRFLEGLLDEQQTLLEALAWAMAIAAALVVHELAHAIAAARLDVLRQVVCIWPLGDLHRPGPGPSAGSREQVIVAAAGPIANLALALSVAVSLGMLGARMQLDPFGGVSHGAPTGSAGAAIRALTPIWWIGCLGHASWILVLANAIPALPFDGGQIIRGLQRRPLRDTDVSTHLAHAAALILGIAGIFRAYGNSTNHYAGLGLLAIAVVIELFVRWEARQQEEAAEMGDEPFGYDFSQGYTSLEASPSAVRPRRESGLARWQRLRAESRRRRQVARENADEQRLDILLEKIHREGRAALTREEDRFLVRQSRDRQQRRARGG